MEKEWENEVGYARPHPELKWVKSYHGHKLEIPQIYKEHFKGAWKYRLRMERIRDGKDSE